MAGSGVDPSGQSAALPGSGEFCPRREVRGIHPHNLVSELADDQIGCDVFLAGEDEDGQGQVLSVQSVSSALLLDPAVE